MRSTTLRPIRGPPPASYVARRWLSADAIKLSAYDGTTASDFACRTNCRASLQCTAYAFDPARGCQLYQGSSNNLVGDAATTGARIGYADTTCSQLPVCVSEPPHLTLTRAAFRHVRAALVLLLWADGAAVNFGSGGTGFLTCTTYNGATASSAPQRRNLHLARSERLAKLVKRMTEQHGAERRAA